MKTLIRVNNIIDKADFAGRNKFFMWYISEIVPKIQEQAVKESSLTQWSCFGTAG